MPVGNSDQFRPVQTPDCNFLTECIQGKQNLGMGDQPARRFYCEMRRRNEFDCWGLEVSGGWGDGQTWCEVSYVR